MSARESAIMVCSLAASNPGLACNYGIVAGLLDLPIDSKAMKLAFAAWRVARDRLLTGARDRFPSTDVLQAIDAEAHAMLVIGWTPEAGS